MDLSKESVYVYFDSGALGDNLAYDWFSESISTKA